MKEATRTPLSAAKIIGSTKARHSGDSNDRYIDTPEDLENLSPTAKRIHDALKKSDELMPGIKK